MNVEWEVQNLQARLYKIEEAIDRKHETLYGNGQEGLTSKVKRISDKVDAVIDWKENLAEVISAKQLEKMLNRIDFLYKGYWYAIGALVVVTGLLVKFGDSLIKIAVQYSLAG